jgi:hypothetical protein
MIDSRAKAHGTASRDPSPSPLPSKVVLRGGMYAATAKFERPLRTQALPMTKTPAKILRSIREYYVRKMASNPRYSAERKAAYRRARAASLQRSREWSRRSYWRNRVTIAARRKAKRDAWTPAQREVVNARARRYHNRRMMENPRYDADRKAAWRAKERKRILLAEHLIHVGQEADCGKCE